MDPILQALREQAGIVFMDAPNATLQTPEWRGRIAMDAQSPLVTSSNSAILALLTTQIDPKVIDVLVAPMKAAEIVGEEVKKGDWLMDTTVFPVIESAGETSSYGDYSENGMSSANSNFISRQSYHYQTVTQYGEREMERVGLAKIDWVNRLNMSAVLNLNKFQNATYFFGVTGLALRGLLNDPALSAPIAPTTETGGLITWAQKDALGVYADIQALYTQLQVQANGLVDLSTKMTLAMSPTSQVALTKTTQFNVNVEDLLKKNFPNLTVKTAPEYATGSGQLLQLIADEIEGQRTAACAFTEKLRAHPIVIAMSSFRQKKSQGTWGTIIYRPFLIAQMIGV